MNHWYTGTLVYFVSLARSYTNSFATVTVSRLSRLSGSKFYSLETRNHLKIHSKLAILVNFVGLIWTLVLPCLCSSCLLHPYSLDSMHPWMMNQALHQVYPLASM